MTTATRRTVLKGLGALGLTGSVGVAISDGYDLKHFEVEAVRDGPAFGYSFVADTYQPRAQTEANNDKSLPRADGNITALGRTGNGYRDDYVLNTVSNFSATTGRDNFKLYLDGEDVTETLVPHDPQTLEVISTGNEEKFSYEIDLVGAAEMIQTGGPNDAEEGNDRIFVVPNGITIQGFTGGGFGDSYRVWTDDFRFKASTHPSNYEVRLK